MPPVRNSRPNAQLPRFRLALGTLLVFVAIHRKGDADTAKNQLGLLASLGHHVARLAGQPFVVGFVVFVVGLVGFVFGFVVGLLAVVLFALVGFDVVFTIRDTGDSVRVLSFLDELGSTPSAESTSRTS